LSGVLIALASVQAPVRADDTNPLLELVDAATQRLQTADPVAASKWKTGGSIEDPQRVEQVLGSVSSAATGKGVDAGYVRRIFTDQIGATEAIEYTRFAQWKLDPGSAPSVAPDLSASRTTHWPVLHSPDCIGMLDDARTAIAQSRMLDSLYQQALSFSTHSYCQ
jgi:chorismate mutase